MNRKNYWSYLQYSGHYSWFFLIIMIASVYMPFMGSRLSRSAGDEKVYVAQALEMERDGRWFVQTLADEPDYYKGPAHYVLLRVGDKIFGKTMWATLYMNLILVILGALAIGAIVHRNMGEFSGWSFFAGAAFALNAGIFSHTFASQMEVELASSFAIALYFLNRANPNGWRDLPFWIIAGIAGWFKSPLHSVFLGLTAIIFWFITKELILRIKSWRAWVALAVGILVCCIGYAPAFFLDRTNFINAYVLRETFGKPANGQPWHYPVIPIFTYFLMPWMFVAFFAYLDGLMRFIHARKNPTSTAGSLRVCLLGISLIIPSVLFFMLHPYRGQNYNLPVIGGLILFITAIWATRSEGWKKYYNLAIFLTAFVIIIPPVIVTIFVGHFKPMPAWWPEWFLLLFWFFCFFAARGIWQEGFMYSLHRPDALARRTVWLFWAVGAVMLVIGEREMIDIRTLINAEIAKGNKPVVEYYNLHKFTWNEWGYLNYMIPYPVSGLHNEAQLKAAVEKHAMVIVPGEAYLDDFKIFMQNKFPKIKYHVDIWHRWKTKGKTADGTPVWNQAWKERNLAILEKDFYIIKFL